MLKCFHWRWKCVGEFLFYWNWTFWFHFKYIDGLSSFEVLHPFIFKKNAIWSVLFHSRFVQLWVQLVSVLLTVSQSWVQFVSVIYPFTSENFVVDPTLCQLAYMWWKSEISVISCFVVLVPRLKIKLDFWLSCILFCCRPVRFLHMHAFKRGKN